MKFGNNRTVFEARRAGECPRCGFAFPVGTPVMFGNHSKPEHAECPKVHTGS